MITITRKLAFSRHSNRAVAAVARPSQHSPLPPRPRVPRIARLMALAIDLDARLRRREFLSQQSLSTALRISQPRLTQILNLNHLAPDIQEALLHLAPAARGRDLIHERRLRRIASELDWDRQRPMWKRLVGSVMGSLG